MPPTRVVQVPLTIGGPRGVNAFILIGERPILVDTGIPGSAPHILQALGREGIDAHEIALILITHAHMDHMGSAWELKWATGAPVAVHPLDAPALRTGTSAPVIPRTPEIQRAFEEMGRRFGEPPKVHGVEPDVLLDDERRLDDFGIAGRVIHTPGHTEGSISVDLDSGDALIGDLMGGSTADPDLPALAPFAVDEAAMTASLRGILALAPATAYVGHGGPFRRELLEKLRGDLIQEG